VRGGEEGDTGVGWQLTVELERANAI